MLRIQDFLINIMRLKKENSGGYAIVGCKNHPDFQVWGARSDLRCKKKSKKELRMRFKDWIVSDEKRR